ncbi:hypothetical protein LINPERHAP1_LOCUS28566 [Linum perenne]
MSMNMKTMRVVEREVNIANIGYVVTYFLDTGNPY